MIVGTIKGQELVLTAPMVVADTIDYLEAKFFFTADWNGTEKWAHFELNDVVYDIRLTDDQISKKDHLNLSRGVWSIYLHGTTPSGTRITTHKARLRVLDTGTLNGQPLPDIPLSAEEQISMMAAEAKKTAESVRKDADEGKFNGAPGPDGEAGNGIKRITATNDGAKTKLTIEFTDESMDPLTFDLMNGVGILSIEKTATNGYVDTYMISLSNGEKSSFTVTNGEKGDRGDKGDTGNGILSITKQKSEGLVDTYIIRLTNGETSQFTVTNGEKGDTGEAPDWNANEGETGHILNRTHYVGGDGVVHKLDNKYIDAAWMATEGSGDTVIIPQQTRLDGMWKDLQGTLEEGVVYAVELNGVLYRCVCRNNGEGMLYLGNGSLLGNTTTEHNNEPFAITWLGGSATSGMLYKDSTLGDSVVLKVTNWGYNKLPKEFLPGISWNELTDKPFVNDTGELLFSQTVTFDTDGASTRVSANNLSLTKGAEYWLEINDDMIKCRCESSSTTGWTLYDAEGNMLMKRSVGYIYIYGQTAGTYTYNLYRSAKNIVLDPQYIPSNIARKSDIPKSTGGGVEVTAAVGQTIRVKAVDADGKPTEWEAVDLQERTHYKTETVVLPETTAEYSEEDSSFLIPFVELIGGAQYKIVYNGVEYVSEILDAREDGVGEILFGNISIMTDTGDNGIPFMGAMTTDGESGMGIVVPIDGAETVTISITQVEYTPIPEQYMANALPYYVEVTADYNSDSGRYNYSCNETCENLEAIYKSGRSIVVRLEEYYESNGNKSWSYFHLAYAVGKYASQHILFAFLLPTRGEPIIYLLPNEDGTYTVQDTLG